MNIIKVQRDVRWLPKPHECLTVLDHELPPLHLVTSVHAFVFQGDALLMAHLTGRHWDIPGGHVEPGEDPESALLREIQEETGAQLGVSFLFAHRLLRLLGAAPAGYRYPHPESYQLFYCAGVASLGEFAPNVERSDRRFFVPAEAHALPWIQENAELYEAALQARKRLTP